MNIELIDHKLHRNGHDYVMTVRFLPSWFERLLGYKKCELKVIGSCTVWHFYPSCRRCESAFESVFSEFWTRIRLER